MSLLQRIVDTKRAEIPALRRRVLPSPPARRAVTLARGAADPLRLVTEIKRRSPSAGPLSTHLSVRERARAYELGGATMISVLCDETYFDGGYEHLAEAALETTIPLLCKEFILDECQLDAARAYGASAALLIVRCLTPERLAELVRAAEERQLVPVVEVFDQPELGIAVAAGATVIGVNARNLDTLEMDAAAASRVAEAIPSGIVRAQFSGVKSAEQVRALAASSVDAALIGEVLMRQDDPTALLDSLARAARELDRTRASGPAP